MAEVKWIKINVDMFDDEKIKIIQSMPEGDTLLVVWIKLITLAGKTNDGGYVYISEGMPYTDEMLSIIMNKPLNTIRLALDTFIKLGMIETDIKGIYLINFEKHQSLDKLEKLKLQNRERVARFREKQKLLEIKGQKEEKNDGNGECNVTGNGDVMVCNGIDIDKEKEIDIDNNINNTPSKEQPEELNNDTLLTKKHTKAIPIIIEYMNKCGELENFKVKKTFNFQAKAKCNQKIIKERLNEECYTINDFKDVIYNAYDKFIEREYKGLNGKSSIQYYTPTTIFTSSKMEKYKNEYRNM